MTKEDVNEVGCFILKQTDRVTVRFRNAETSSRVNSRRRRRNRARVKYFGGVFGRPRDRLLERGARVRNNRRIGFPSLGRRAPPISKLPDVTVVILVVFSASTYTARLADRFQTKYYRSRPDHRKRARYHTIANVTVYSSNS